MILLKKLRKAYRCFDMKLEKNDLALLFKPAKKELKKNYLIICHGEILWIIFCSQRRNRLINCKNKKSWLPIKKCVAYSISSVAETRDRALSFF